LLASLSLLSGSLFVHITPPTAPYTLSLHDALPIFCVEADAVRADPVRPHPTVRQGAVIRDVEGGEACGKGLGDDERFDGTLSNRDRKSTRLNSSHVAISYAVFCLKKKKKSEQI